MARNEAKIRFTAETRDLTNQLRSANSALAALRAGLKLNDAELKNNGDQTEYLKNKQQLLQTELQMNAQKQEALTGKLEAAKAIYGENSTEVQSWATKLTQAKTEQQQLETQLNQCTQELEEQARAEEKARSPLEQLNTKISEQKSELERLKTEYKNVALEQGTGSQEAQELKGKIDQLNSELGENETKLKQVDDALESTGDEAQKSASGGWTVLNQVIADLASNAIQQAINKLQDFARETMNLGIDFSSSMSNVQAISGATGDEIAMLEQRARDLGATTVYSASDVADGFGYMAMAGWDTQQMMDGIAGVLDLAASSGEDLATTSDIVTDALTAFGMEAGDAGRLADVMAAASSNANTNVSMLGESFKYVAPVAGALGYSAEDTAVALGLMANSGIKASQGGTALRTVLTNMAKPTDDMAYAMEQLGVSLTDDEGNMYSLHDVMSQLRSGFGDLMMSEEDFNEEQRLLQQALDDGAISQTEYNDQLDDLIERAYGAEGAEKARYASMLAGKEGMSGLLAIVNASEEDYGKLTEAIYGSAGAAEEMAGVMNDNLGGDIKEMNSALEEFKLKIFDSIQQPMRDIVQFITGSVIPAATQTLQFIQQHSTAIGVLAGIIALIVTGIGLYNAVQAVKAAMNAAEAASLGALVIAQISATATAWAAVLPYIAIVAAIAAVIAIIVICVTHWEQIKQKVTEVAEVVRTNVTQAWNNLRTSLSNITNNIRATITQVWNNIRATLNTIVTNIRTTVTSIWNNLRSTLSSIMEGIRSKVQSIWDAIKEHIITPIQDAYNSVTDKVSELRSSLNNTMENIKSGVQSAWQAIKDNIITPVQDAYNNVTQKISDLKSSIEEKINDMRDKVQSTFDSIQERMESPIQAARDTIDGVISTIRGWFPLSIGRIIGDIELPHFSLEGSFSINPPSVPHISVSWWASGAVFDAPTLIPTINGVHGVGEAGPEAVSPISVLQSYVSAAVQKFVPQIDYDLLGQKVAAACAKIGISIELDKRQLGRVVREVV